MPTIALLALCSILPQEHCPAAAHKAVLAKLPTAAIHAEKDIVTTAVEAGSFPTLVAALKAAELVGALQEQGPFTVLAPTEEAFAKLPKGTVENLLKPENKAQLQAILKYHVVAGEIDAAAAMKASFATTLQGQRATITTKDGQVMIEGANVVKADIACSNGIIHVIDGVILPSAKDAAKSDDVDTASEEAYAKLKGNRAGEERELEIAPGVKMTFCWCPAGEFVMGSPTSEEGRDSRDEDQAKVTLTKGFWIAKTELSQAQWESVMGNNPALQKEASRPAVGVSWNDAQLFLEKINASVGHEDGGKFSLPTEAQFEYAARAGEAGMYPGGSLDEVAWHAGNSKDKTHPVGTKKANAWGLHDMSGNAWEWVLDCYYPELTGGTDPIATEWGVNRVIRGGCWLKEAADSRLATRSFRAQMASQCYSIGVRIVRNSWPVEAPKPAIIDPGIHGPNVTKITYQGSSIEKSFVQTGPKRWTSGEVAYTEVNRDEWSVHLHRADAEDALVQIDLYMKKVVFRGQGPKSSYPISSASK